MTVFNLKKPHSLPFRTLPSSNLIVHWSLELQCQNDCIYCYRYKNITEKPLSLKKGIQVIERLSENNVTHLILTGADPIYFDNIPEYLAAAADQGIFTGLDVDGRNFTSDMLNKIQPNLDCLGIPIDSCNPEINDKLRGIEQCKKAKLLIDISSNYNFSIRVHTVVTKLNLESLPELAAYLNEKEIAIWSLHELSPVFVHNDSSRSWYDNNVVSAFDINNFVITISAKFPNLKIRVVPESTRKNNYLLISPSGLLYTHPNDNNYKTVGSILKYSLKELALKADVKFQSLATSTILEHIHSKGEKNASIIVIDSAADSINNTKGNSISAISYPFLVFRDRTLRGLTFNENVMKHARFIRCDLSHTQFIRSDLYRSRFQSCILYDTRFVDCNLTRCDFRSSALYGIRIQNCDTVNSVFDKVLSFPIVKSVPSPDLSRSEELSKSEIYGLLSKLKRDSLDYEEASEYRYLQKVTSRKKNNIIFRSIEYLFADLPSKYGESPGRVATTSVFAILIFAFIYYLFPDQVNPKTDNFFQAFYFSIFLFTTLGFGEFVPVWHSIWFPLIIGLESICGVVLVSLFLIAFVRRILKE